MHPLFTKLHDLIESIPSYEKVDTQSKAIQDDVLKILSLIGQIKVHNKRHPKPSVDYIDLSKSPILLGAMQRGWGEKIVIKLIEAGAVTTEDYAGITPLMLAAIRNDLKIAQMLIQAGAPLNTIYDFPRSEEYPDGDENNAYTLAVKNRNPEMAALLMSAAEKRERLEKFHTSHRMYKPGRVHHHKPSTQKTLETDKKPGL